MAEPKQKSLEVPFLWRLPTLWQIPQWAQANQWRWFVYNQPIAMLCRQRLINYLTGIPQEVSARDPKDKDALIEDCKYYNKWVLKKFDLIFELLWQDALDLPIGGNVEIARWPVGTKPVIKEGDEEYKVTRDHPKGHPDRLIFIDGATLFPTYDDDLPVAQRIPEIDKVVYFTPDDLGRVGIQPRTEMRLRGYYKAPPEQVYLSITMVNDTDHFYHDLVKNVPPVGILDLIDMAQQDAMDWTASTRALFEGTDPFKIPVLYQHTAAANFIPFGKSPQELMMDKTGQHYARIVAASYGLTLGNLGLEPKGETLAGSIRDDAQAEQGYNFIVEKTKGLLDDAVLPPYLEWSPKIQNNEKLTGKGRAFLVNAQALKAAKDTGALKPSEVQAQLVRDGFITVEVEVPNDEELAQQAMAAKPGFGPDGKPMNGNGKEAEKVADKVSPAQGGRGDVTGKADVEKATLAKTDYRPAMTTPLARALDAMAAKATPPRLKKLARVTAKLVLSQVQKAEGSDDWQESLDRVIAGESWHILPSDLVNQLLASYTGAYSEGATEAAIEVLRSLGDLSVGIDFNLTNPATLAQLEEKAALLVSRINDGTKFYLKRMLVSGVEEGLASPEIAALIREGASVDEILSQQGFLDGIVQTVKAELEGMTQARVESIVNTEINRAESEGRLGQWREMGLTRKFWRTFGVACDICKGNEAKGFVEMGFVYDDVFDGTLTPPGHPNVCRCNIEFDERELMSKAGELKVWTGGDGTFTTRGPAALVVRPVERAIIPIHHHHTPVNVNINTPEHTFNVNMPEQRAGDIIVNVPESSIENQVIIPEPPAQIINVNVPEQTAPDVFITNEVTTPEVTVNVPEQAAPDIYINPELKATLDVPAVEEEIVDIQRDQAGFIKSARKVRRRGK